MTRTDVPAPPTAGTVRDLRDRLSLSPGQRRELLRDGLLALAVVVAEAIVAASEPASPAQVLWSIGCALPIALRRVAPWWAVGLATPVCIAAVLAAPPLLATSAAFIVLTYTTAAWLPLRQAALAALVLWAPAMLSALLQPPPPEAGVPTPATIFTQVLFTLLCFFIGRTVHARRATIQALEERARTAEENQRALAEQAVADERRRIARELHDVVAHHVSVMGVLATGARRVLARDPGAADNALGTIEETSRTTLRELRRLLDVLRTDAEPAAELSPQPGLAGIESLVEQVREAGLPVSLRIDGTPGPLDPGVALTIFRIVQEALTNTLKHAGSATAQVRLSFGVYWLVVEVSDTGRGPAPQPGRFGHGLVGMRERVALYGGTLRTGPRPGGGYRVYAKIPMEQLGAETPADETVR